MKPNEKSGAVVVHPSTRVGFARERQRKAAEIENGAERRSFLTEALAKYRIWANSLGVAPQRIARDVAALEAELLRDDQRRRA
jgi:hypothetical protein